MPSGPFELGHRSLQSGLRAWVERQTGHPLGYIEQLYTFADRDRIGDEPVQRVISISYLGLTREEQRSVGRQRSWRNWYDYFPWEDHRAGVPSILPDNPHAAAAGLGRRGRQTPTCAATAGSGRRLPLASTSTAWNEELVLQRYELLYEAALVAEALRGQATRQQRCRFPADR